MKKILTLIIGLLMIFAALVASGEPTAEAPTKQIVVTEAICIIILIAGAFWLLRTFGDESKERR